MDGPEKQTTSGSAGRRGVFCLLLGGGVWLLASGCAQDNRYAGDPLLGGAAATRAAAPQAQAAVVPPPQPPPAASASTAALAAQTFPPLDGARDLRIPAPAPASPVDSRPWQAQPTAMSAGVPPQSAPVAPATVPLAPTTSPAPHVAPTAQAYAPPNGVGPTYEQAQAILAARGVTWQRLETVGDKGDWKFSCSIPNPQNRFINHNYEAQAHDSLSAIRAVLDQIGKEH